MEDAAEAIQVMRVRGAPLIGATAAFGLYFALRDDATDAALQRAYEVLHATRPTAINLRWALDRVKRVVAPVSYTHLDVYKRQMTSAGLSTGTLR